MSDIDPGSDRQPEFGDLRASPEANGAIRAVPQCPSLTWTVFWLIFFYPIALYLAFRSFGYRRAIQAAGGQPEARSLVILVLTGICSLLWLLALSLAAYFFIKYVAIPFSEGYQDGTQGEFSPPPR